MRAKRLLLWVPLALVLLLGIGTAWLFTADLGFLKPRLERLVSAELGREFAIDGDLHLFLGRRIQVSASHLRLANPPWAAAPQLGQVGHMEAEIDLLSLLEGPVIIERLAASDIEFNGEVSADGAASWVLVDPSTVTTEREIAIEPPVLLRHVELRDASLKFTGPEFAREHVVSIRHLNQQQMPDGMLQVRVGGEANNEALAFDGQVGPFDNLLAARDVRMQGAGQIASLHWEGSAFIDALDNPQYPTFELVLEGPDITDLGRLLGRETALQGPFRVLATAERRGLGLGVDLEARLGEIAIDLHGTSRSISDYTAINYDLQASGPDLGALTRLVGAGPWPHEPFTLNGSVTRDGRNLELEDIVLEVGGTRLDLDGSLTNFPNINDGSVTLDIAGPDIARFRELMGFEGVAEGPFRASARLDSAVGAEDRLRAELATSLVRLTVDGTVGAGENYVGTRMQASAVINDAQALMGGFGWPGFPADPLELQGNFELLDRAVRFEPGTTLTLNDDRAVVEGQVGFEPLEHGTDLRFELSGDDLGQLGVLAGRDLPLPHEPYRLAGGFKADAAGYHVNSINGTIGPNRLVFDGLVTRRDDLAGTDFTFGLEGPNLETLVRDTERFDVPADPFQVNGHFRHLEDRLRFERLNLRVGALAATATGEVKLPFDGSYAAADLSITGPDVNAVLPEFPDVTVVSQPFDLRGKVTVKQGQWTIEEGRVEIADARLAVGGVFDQLPDFSNTSIDFDLAVPSQAALGSIQGNPLPDLPVRMSGHVTGNRTQVRLDDLDVTFGSSDFRGSVIADYSGPVPGFAIQTHSRLIDMRDLRGPGGAKDEEYTPPADGRLIPDMAFPLEEMAKYDVRIDITADEYRSLRRRFKNYLLDVDVRDGALVMNRLRAEGLEGHMEGSAALRPLGGERAELAARLQLQGLKLNLSRDHKLDQSVLPVLTLDVDVRGQGKGLREAAAGLNGYVSARSSSGKIPNSALGFLDKGFLQQIFGVVLPKTEQSQTTNLQCFGSRWDFNNGVAETNPGAILVTDKVRMMVSGKINLANEAIDLSFETHPAKAYSANVSEVLVNPFVKITGTLANPKPTIAPGRALLFGGAAAVTGGLSILAKGLWDRVSKSSDPCEEIMAETAQ